MDIFKSWLVEKYIAHRGLHSSEVAENSLTAFSLAIEKNYPIEIDVQLISDGTVVVFHDEILSRSTGKDGYLKNLTKKELKKTFLKGTKDTIHTFEEVLKLVDGKIPLLIEIKNTQKVGELEAKVLDLLKNYKGEFAIQSFNPYVLMWFKQNAPEILRGQLSCSFKGEKMAFFKKFVLKRMLLNKSSKPNFISYCGQDLPNRFVKRYNKIPLLAWTIRSQEDYMKVVKYCDNIIFEDFEPTI
ncbi:MAG: glycerophosphodiester phosphodiesterase family protein [Clostridia bacterium]